jgi:histone deacetylase complex regulatory component SIN3
MLDFLKFLLDFWKSIFLSIIKIITTAIDYGSTIVYFSANLATFLFVFVIKMRLEDYLVFIISLFTCCYLVMIIDRIRFEIDENNRLESEKVRMERRAKINNFLANLGPGELDYRKKNPLEDFLINELNERFEMDENINEIIDRMIEDEKNAFNQLNQNRNQNCE